MDKNFHNNDNDNYNPDEDELNQWRRTHYSNEIDPSFEDSISSIIIMGWVSSVRDHGNIQFITINDRYGEIQMVVKKGECNPQLYDQILKIKEHTSIGVKGRIVSQKKSPNRIELIPIEIKIFSLPRKPSPFIVQQKTQIGIDTRLDLRALDLRRNLLRNIFLIRNNILQSVREFLLEKGFIEVNTPKMIATATEGGTALFPIFYYDREAFLAQSPQIYKEQLTMAFENVFEIGPIFRAEPSRTNRHLSEAMSIDIEKAFVDYNDIMSIIENMIMFIIEKMRDKNKKEIEFLRLDKIIDEVKIPFPRYTYSEIVNTLQHNHENIRWGNDLSPQLLKKSLSGNEKFYFITDWPSSIKPFYVKEKKSLENQEGQDRKISESFDLMFESLEISSGSTRINRKEILEEKMRKKGLNLNSFDYHLRVFDFGMPPHAGCGIGLERLLMAITNTENIRDTVLYPRDIDRLTP